ncbi:MAG: hypothetical protein ABTQ26_00280 [Azonexus sp.]
MELTIGKMRADFGLVAKACKDSGEWSEADVREFGEAIKAAIERKDEACIILWARDMAIRANDCLYRQLVVRGVEASIRARAAAEKVGKGA